MPSRELRERLEDAALRMFQERGFDAVTVGEICEAAGTSPATFYRYFRTKEQLLLGHGDEVLDALRAAIGGACADGTVDLRRVVRRFVTALGDRGELFRSRFAVARAHERVLGASLVVERRWHEELASALAGGGAIDLRCRVGGAVAVAVISAALDEWAAGASGSLDAIADQAVALVPQVLAAS